MSFIEELKRRNVAKVAVLYIVFAWLLLQVTDVLSSLLPVPEWTGSLVFVLLVIGFPAVLTFSWIYELTPEGIKREKEVDRTQSITGETGRKINVLIIVLLVLAIATVLIDRLIPERAPMIETAAKEKIQDREVEEARLATPSELAAEKFAPAPDRSIAVLPFVNMSSDPEQEYFSDGLSEELLNLLAQVPDLTVASRTSAFSFKGKDVKIAQVAAELNVAHVLEGSVRKAGNQVRITAQLIDAERDVHLWSETWDRTLEDVFAIQDEIASSVVDELKVTLLGQAPEVATTDPEAYNLFLQGRHLVRQGSRESMLRAIEVFEQALAIDPNYAPAWNGIGTAYTNLAGSNAIPQAEGYATAKEMAEKALSVDPGSAQSYVGLGWLARVDGDYETAARHIEQALKLAPNDDKVLNAAAVLLGDLLRPEEDLRIQKLLVERDPVNPSAYHNMGVVFYSLGNMDAAVASFDKALTLSPDMILAGWWRAYLHCVQKEYQTCLDAYASVAELAGNEAARLLGEAIALHGMGREEDSASALATLESDYFEAFAYTIAATHAQQGRIDRSIALFERAYEQLGVGTISFINRDPRMAFLKEDPRMQALLEKAGLSEAQIAAIEFDVRIPS
ncbi:MAG: tetratricopeptide repeat protein [Gammaproteobacteria bacterium]|jgi:TolB-like protein/Tfp pilus assembly protein PilF